MRKSVKNNLEIERKFLIKNLPKNLKRYRREEITQGYLTGVTKSNDSEIRLRKRGNKYFQTFKKGSSKTRLELEININQKQFKSLWPKTKGWRVRKTRYLIPYKNWLIELDIYHGELKGLITAEIEFKTVKDSNQFVIPEWFGRETTDDIRYKNRTLAVRGLPADLKK